MLAGVLDALSKLRVKQRAYTSFNIFNIHIIVYGLPFAHPSLVMPLLIIAEAAIYTNVIFS